MQVVAGLAPQAARAEPVAYSVTIQGAGADDLNSVLQGSSSLVKLKDKPPPSLFGLRLRADADRDRLLSALRSEGYYQGSLAIDVEPGAGTPPGPARVVIKVDPGPAYHFAALRIVDPAGAALPGLAEDRAALGLKAGDRAQAAAVINAEQQITARLAERGYAFAKVADRHVVVDRATQAMNITLVVARGPLIRFGTVTIRGAQSVRPAVVQARVPWKPGQVYSPALLEKARKDINDLGVFSGVRVDLASAPGPDGVTPVEIQVQERPPRTIGFALNYSSTDGFGANAYWTHHNLFGGAEELKLSAETAGIGRNSGQQAVTKSDQSLNAAFRKPDFLQRDQALLLDAALLHERPEAYSRLSATTDAKLERILSKGFKASLGVSGEYARLSQNGATTISRLVGLPAALSYDATNSLLNPVQGYRLSAEATPYWQTGTYDSGFTVTRLTGSAYYQVLGGGRVVLAGLATIGSIAGTGGLAAVPAHKRFYAGGGGSVRGYGYQKVGPKNSADEPTGGRSLFVVNAEMRIKVTDTIGVVPFVDGGNVFDASLPSFSRPLKWGAGLGVRYYTGFGPLRADVAVPINRDPGDDRWALYLSIGQAF